MRAFLAFFLALVAYSAGAQTTSFDSLTNLLARDWRSFSGGRVTIETRGYASPGDGGGGTLYLDSADTNTVADNVLVYAATPYGRYKRIHSGVVNVKWAGAIGNGSDDDTAAIQAVLDAGKSVHFPDGTYAANGLILSGDKTITLSKDAVILANGTPDQYKAVFSLTNGSKIEIIGGTIDASAITERSFSVIQVRDATNVSLSLQGTTITNYIFGGINLWNWSGSLNVDDCEFRNGREHTGVLNEDSRAITAYGVTGTDVAQIRVTRSRFINDATYAAGATPTGVYIKSNDGWTHAHIEGNYFDNCGTDIAGNLTGSIDLYQGVDGSIFNNYVQRSQGLGIKVQENENIRVENNTVDGSGNNPGASYFFGIHWNPNPRAYYNPPKGGVVIRGNTVKNFTHTNSFAIGTSNSVTNRGRDAVVDDNYIINCARGIYFDAPAGRLSIRNNTIKDTTIIGLGIFRPLTNEFSSVVIDGNRFENIGGEAGVTIEQLNGVLKFNGNTYTGTKGIGIGAGYGSIQFNNNVMAVTNANVAAIVNASAVSPVVLQAHNNTLTAATTNYYALAIQNVSAAHVENNRLTSANATTAQVAGLAGPSSVWLVNNTVSGAVDTSGATVLLNVTDYGPFDVPVSAVFRTLAEFATTIQVTNRVGIGVQPVYPLDIRSTDAVASRWHNPGDTGTDALTLYLVSGTTNTSSGSLQAFHGGYADATVADRILLRANTDATGGIGMRLNLAGQKFEVQNPSGTLFDVDYVGAVRSVGTNAIHELIVTNGITLGGVRQTTWPAGGTNTGGLTFVSGTAVTNINLNNTTPAAPATGANVLWQLSSTNASAYLVTSNFPTLNGTNTFTSTNTFGTVVADTLEVTSPIPLSAITNAVATDAEVAAAYQPLDSDLTAVAGLSGNGLLNRTGTGVITNIALPGDTTNFLRADGTFAVPPGGGTNVFPYDIDVTAATTNATAVPVFTNVVTAGYSDYAIVDILASGVTNSASFRLFAWARNDSGTLTFRTNAPDAWQPADPDLTVLAGNDGSALTSTGATNDNQLVTLSQLRSFWKQIASFTPLQNQPPTNNYATLSTRNGFAILQFDPTTEESATFVGFIPPDSALTSGIAVDITWMTTATSGAGRWGAKWMRLTTDLDADSYDATPIEATTATTSATAGIPTTTSLTTTNLDGLVAGEPFRLLIYRDTGDAADTINSDDLQVIGVNLKTAN